MAILPRHAVLLIHGIGEQRPHETLRSFVRARARGRRHGIVPDTAAVYGASDHISGRLDTRKLKVSWDQKRAADHLGLDKETVKTGGIRTDFYECYWASGFRDTSWRHVRSWLFPIIFRGRKKILSPRFRGVDAPALRIVHWLILCASALLVVLSAEMAFPRWVMATSIGALSLAILLSSWLGVVTLVRSIAIAGVAAWIGVVVGWPDAAPDGWLARVLGITAVPLITGFLAGFFTRGLGDAARYFDDRPDNVNEIEAVRRTALKMIEAIHEERDPATNRFRYDRLVVVGHSLGSVIAYDAVRHSWNQKNRSLLFPALEATDPVSGVVRRVEKIAAELPTREEIDPAPVTGIRTEYRVAQQALCRLLRDGRPALHREDTKGRWIVSDLVTVGSPLAYADVFLAKDNKDLSDRIYERLLAPCPPRYQEKNPGYMRFETAGRKRSCLHQAAVFAPVRWTNMFFSHDYIGGPVAPMFGAGIDDVQLDDARAWPGWFAISYPHSSYWTEPGRWRAKRNKEGFERCVQRLSEIVQPNPVLLILMKWDQPPTTLADVLQIAHILQETRSSDPTEPGLIAEVRLLANDDNEDRDYIWVPGPSPIRITRASVAALQEWVGARGRVTVRTSVPE